MGLVKHDIADIMKSENGMWLNLNKRYWSLLV